MKKNFGFAGALIGIFSLSACGQVATSAPDQMVSIQAVTFNPSTGEGWVGKGDVQLALSFNNTQLQNAVKNDAISFTYVDTVTVTLKCEKEVEVGKDKEIKVITRDFERTRGVNATVAYEARKNSNGLNGPVTGFFLTGFSSFDSTGGKAKLTCTGELGENSGWFGEATETSSGGGLKVNGVPLS